MRRHEHSLRGMIRPVALVLALASVCCAQEAAAPTPDERIESFLEARRLTPLLAEQLALRVEQTKGAPQVEAAERLASVYVELLTAADTTEQRKEWEQRSRALLSAVPQADSVALRLNLARAVYLRAEEIVERHRLRLAKPEEVSEAEHILRDLRTQLNDLSVKANRRVDTLERAEETEEPSDELAESLAESRRTRSLAFYYAGWTDYYLALISGSEQLAADAMKDFGWLLNSRGGRAATLDRLSARLLRYDHIARAAIGCGLCAALRGNDTEAVRWLDAVQGAEGLSDSVKKLLFARRVTVLAGAKRWADLERLVRVQRKADRSGGGPDLTPLETPNARLLAVVSLEADRSVAGELIERLAGVALGDLVALGEVGHVLDLVDRYGTAPLGDRGFIVQYVRGLQSYEKAKSQHQQSGASTDEPPTSPEIKDRYRAAAALLESALTQPDAASFGAERGKAAMLLGLSLYYAGENGKAAARFAEASRLARSSDDIQEAMWLSYVALDRAADASPSPEVKKKRDEAAAVFLGAYPDSERAARLLLRRADTGLVTGEDSVRVMLGVSVDSPVYEPARRQAARLLYQMFKNTRGSGADFAAARFVPVGEEVLEMDRRVSMEGHGKEAKEATDRVVTRARQLLDALLSVSVPDADRAEGVFKVLDLVAVFNNLDLARNADEFKFRRAQIAAARQDDPTAAAIIESLQSATDASHPGGFADAGDRLIYRRIVAEYEKARLADPAGFVPSTEMLTAIVRHGSRIIRRLGGDIADGSPPAGAPTVILTDASILTLYLTVAQAAEQLWRADHSAGYRDLSIALDKAVLAVSPTLQVALRRLAELAEDAGDVATAGECWRTLLAATPVGVDGWFEARLHSIRLLAGTDPAAARVAFDQHRALYPALGPPPWGEKFTELEKSLPAPIRSLPGGPGGTP